MSTRFTVQVDKKSCQGCELCVVVCPHDVLEMCKVHNSKGRGPKVRVIAEAKCMGCQRCVEICPDGAIEVDPDEE